MEAEKTLPQLIKAIKEGRTGEIPKIAGAVYRKGVRIRERKRAAFLTEEEIKRLPFVWVDYAFKHRTNGGTTVGAYTERGCPNACVFCTVPRKGRTVRLSDETIISGIIKLAADKRITSIGFEDDQLFSDKKRAERILNKIIELGLNKRFRFTSLATVDSLMEKGKVDYQFIQLAKRAGFGAITLGT